MGNVNYVFGQEDLEKTEQQEENEKREEQHMEDDYIRQTMGFGPENRNPLN